MSGSILSRRLDRFPVAGRILHKSYLFTKWAAKLVGGALGWAVGLVATLVFFGGLVQPDNHVASLAHWVTGHHAPPDVIGARVCLLIGLLVGGALLGLCSALLTETWEAFPFRKRAS